MFSRPKAAKDRPSGRARRQVKRNSPSRLGRLCGVDGQVFVPWRAEGVEDTCLLHRLHPMRDVRGQIIRVAGDELMRLTLHDQTHPTGQDMDDLLLRMLMFG